MTVDRIQFPRGREVVASAVALLHWWMDELAAAFPKAAAALSSRMPVVELETAAALRSASSVDAGVSTARGVVIREFGNPAPGSSPLLAVAGGLDRLSEEELAELRRVCEGRRVDVVLSGADVFRTSVRLPRAAVTDEGLRYALQSESPVKLEYLAFAWCVEQPQPEGLASEWQQVRVGMCRRSTLDRTRELLARTGVSVRRIGASYDADPLATGPALDARGFVFFRQRESGLASPAGRGLLVLLAFLAFLVPPIVGGVLAGYRAAAVRAEAEVIRTEHGSALPLAQRRASLASLDATLRPRLQSVPATTLLDDLAQRLGDNVWIQEARIEGAQLRLQVQPGPNIEADAIVSALAASPRIAELRLETLAGGAAGGVGRTLELSAVIRRVDK